MDMFYSGEATGVTDLTVCRSCGRTIDGRDAADPVSGACVRCIRHETAADTGRAGVSITDASLHPGLRYLNPTQRMFHRGDLALLSRPLIAVIGSRALSPFGTAVASLAGRLVAEAGGSVVSGGALGADTVAADACLRAGNLPVLVLACGLDDSSLASLAADQRRAISEVLDAGGLLLSEQPEGTRVRRQALLDRNRIIAALSAGVVVAQAALPSGSMSTVWRTFELPRPLIAPQPPADRRDEKGAQGPLLLSRPRPAGADALRHAGCPQRLIGRLQGRAPLTPLCPQSREELHSMIQELVASAATAFPPHRH